MLKFEKFLSQNWLLIILIAIVGYQFLVTRPALRSDLLKAEELSRTALRESHEIKSRLSRLEKINTDVLEITKQIAANNQAALTEIEAVEQRYNMQADTTKKEISQLQKAIEKAFHDIFNAPKK